MVLVQDAALILYFIMILTPAIYLLYKGWM